MRIAATLLAVLLTYAPLAALAQSATPVGLWRTFDDATGHERGLVRITEQNGMLYGAIESTIDPTEGQRLCTKCTDDRSDHRIIGLSIIRGLRREGNEWTDGTILDPETGSVYRCTLQLDPTGTRLIVRGYIGFSFIGRSQTWLRTP